MLVLSGLRTVQVRGIVGSTHDIFCPTLPPTFENDEKYRGKWWRRGAVTAIAGLVGPVCGVADSLYAIAKKG